ncbi:hypothetical protein Droror1_Dr00011572 [Drosera rotundifolia]
MPETRWDDGELEDDVVALFGEENFSFQLYIFFESNNQSHKSRRQKSNNQVPLLPLVPADHLDQVLLSSSVFFLGIEGFLKPCLRASIMMLFQVAIRMAALRNLTLIVGALVIETMITTIWNLNMTEIGMTRGSMAMGTVEPRMKKAGTTKREMDTDVEVLRRRKIMITTAMAGEDMTKKMAESMLIAIITTVIVISMTLWRTARMMRNLNLEASLEQFLELQRPKGYGGKGFCRCSLRWRSGSRAAPLS